MRGSLAVTGRSASDGPLNLEFCALSATAITNSKFTTRTDAYYCVFRIPVKLNNSLNHCSIFTNMWLGDNR